MRRLSLVIFLMFFGILGCKSTQSSDVAGEWIMTDASRQILPLNLQKAVAKLVIAKDGTFNATELPGLFQFRDPPRLNTGLGAWKLDSEDSRLVHLDFAIVDKNSEVTAPYGAVLRVSKGLTGLTLYYSLGDPDEGKRVEFARH
jgi:hypothetical protein